MKKQIVILTILLMVLLPIAEADLAFQRTRRVPIDEVLCNDDTYVDCTIEISVDEPDYSLTRIDLHTLGIGILAIDSQFQNESFQVLINATFAGVNRSISAWIGLDDYSFLTDIDWTFYPPHVQEYVWEIPAKITMLGNKSLGDGNMTIEVVYAYTAYIDEIPRLPPLPREPSSPLFMIGLVILIAVPIIVIVNVIQWWRRR